MREKFENWKPTNKILPTLNNAIQIIDEYQAEGYILNLRQLYYRLIALGLFPEDRRFSYVKSTGKWKRDENGTRNAPPNYKWLGDMIGRGRLAGLVDWGAIEDRGRKVEKNPHWNHPGEILRTAVSSFQIDKWKNQTYRIFVLCEKDALSNILLPVCKEMDVTFSANKGYASLSHVYHLAKQMEELVTNKKQTPIILYFGDHDPSGLDMDRDIIDRISLLSNSRWRGLGLDFSRLALTKTQIDKYNPPPNPAKITDSRAKGYIKQFGGVSWELDALEPQVLNNLCRDAILGFRDDDLWEEKVEIENKEKEKLLEIANNWK